MLTTLQFSLLQWTTPGSSPRNIGVFLYDSSSGSLSWRFIDEWTKITTSTEDYELLALLSEHFAEMAAEMGPELFLTHLEDTLSNTLRITNRAEITANDVGVCLNELFFRHVAA